MTDTYDATREILGKLPKDFTRPTSCNTPWVESAFVSYAVACTTTSGGEPHVEDDFSCYPTADGLVGVAFPDMQFFSPASICPQGFTSACNVTKNVFDPGFPTLTYGSNATEQVVHVLNDGETAIGCCASGFGCDTYWVGTCTSTVTPGATVSGLTYGRSCASEPIMITFSSSPDPTDLGISPWATASQLNIWLLHDPEKDVASASSGSSRGLPTGAKIGLGVGIPLGVIALVAIVFAFWHRKRKLEKEKRRQKDRRAGKPTDEPALPPHLEKPELQGSEGPAVMGAAGRTPNQKPELDTKTATSTAAVSKEPMAPELDSSQTGTGSKHELPSHTSATITNLAELSGDPYRYELDAGDGIGQKERGV